MKQLANGNRYSGVKVTPANWEKTSSTKKNWNIYYRFYDDSYKDQYPNGMQVWERGMNAYKDIDDRRDHVRTIIDKMTYDVEVLHWNPITGYSKEIVEPEYIDYEIHPDTGLCDALQAAFEKKKDKVSNSTKIDLQSVLRYLKIAADDLKLSARPVKDISRRHMLAIMERLEKVKTNTIINKKAGKKGQWSSNTHNHYRSHLMMLFEELCHWETIDRNPMAGVEKKKHVVKKRVPLTAEEATLLDESLRKDNYGLWRLMHIFFHSGARETEMAGLKYEDVNLARQEVKYTILKGSAYRQEVRPIADDALHLWEQVVSEAKPGQYLFSHKLQPADKAIDSKNLFCRRWNRWVKVKYGINVDMYVLKHAHSTAVKKKLGTRLAALYNQHTEAILEKHYDLDGKDADMQILKSIPVSFIPQTISQ